MLSVYLDLEDYIIFKIKCNKKTQNFFTNLSCLRSIYKFSERYFLTVPQYNLCYVVL